MQTRKEKLKNLLPDYLRGELRHSRWRRACACNHSDVTEIKGETATQSGCCLERLVEQSRSAAKII